MKGNLKSKFPYHISEWSVVFTVNSQTLLNQTSIMKRINQLLLFTFLMVLAAQLPAQVVVNPKVGINFSGFKGDIKDFQAESRVGWNAGIDLRFGESAFYFTPGLHYYSFTAELQKNSNLQDNIQLEENTSIQSLRAPLNLGIRLTGEGGLMALHARGGIVPSYTLSVQEKENFDLDIDDLNRFNYGANVGLGLDIAIFTVDVNYEFGLSEPFKDSGEKPNFLTASVGIKF